MRKDTVVQLRQPGTFSEDPLTEVLRLGARRLLARAVEMEVTTFRRDARRSDGRGGPATDRTSRVFAGAQDPDRHWSGCGALSQGARPRRRRDGATDPLHLIDPAALSQARQVDRGTPALALSEGASPRAISPRRLRRSLGRRRPGFSASTIVRLKEVWQGEMEHWQRRDLSARRLRLLLGRRHLLLTTARRQAMHPGDHRRR